MPSKGSFRVYSNSVTLLIDSMNPRFRSDGPMFVFGFVITDGTGAIPVMVAEKDAVIFLNGLQPTPHPTYHSSIQKYIDKVMSCPVNSLFAIKSFVSGDGIRRYRLFGTTCVA